MKSISYLGPEGSYCEQAALTNFSNEKLFPMPTIPAVIESVQDDITDMGVVPIENSIEGSVTFTLDSLIHDFNVNINGEIMLNISHSLITNKINTLDNIKKIYSHPQALAQCRIYLSEKLPQADLIPSSSTSAAFSDLINAPENSAAIAHARNAKKHNLNIIEENIQDELNNITRFAILSKKKTNPTQNDKTSFCFDFTDSDKPGQLIDVMRQFSDNNINITKIESRPSKKQLGKYIFWMDIDGHSNDNDLNTIFEKIKPITNTLKIIGSYQKSTSIH
tara:strand:+ start:267 stop:1100 length:834 start_codon:yes stop_codon:yes gene_type:complete